ncbi:MAG: VWA domain-containing protein [Pyrinomonadaceae bacterium]
MFKRFALLSALCLFASVVGIRAQTSDPTDTIKIDTRLVSIPVIVSDRNGRYVPNLTAADFTVFQDGAQQNIDFFAAVEEPLTIALLIDTSQSTRPVLGDIKDSAKSFIKLLTPKDRAMVVTFDYATHILSGLTSDQRQLERAIKDAEIPDRIFGTTMRDAVYQTVAQSFRGLTGRKAIILLTDGKDVGSQIRAADLLYRLQETDTLIYTIMFTTGDRQRQAPMIFGGGRRRGVMFPMPRGNPKRDERVQRNNEIAEDFLLELSDTTAGRFYSSKDGKLKKTFATIVEELRFQYRLGFYPPDDGANAASHALKVKVSKPDTVVRSRSGYRVQAK